ALPAPLQEFHPRGAVFAAENAPEIAFPPDGAAVELTGQPLVLRIEGGTPPFTLLANGAPIITATPSRRPALSLAPGHVQLAVIDASGEAARVQVELK
ncbi:MAG: penicillin-binding protein 1C, partial [Maritimibacter sp.]